MKLYCFWMSSCSWRVRLAFAFKGLPFEYQAVDLSKDEHLGEEYKKINPLSLVPALETDEGEVICDSIAILEYLEEKFPDKPLLPRDLRERAVVRQIVNLVASNIQPLQNLNARIFIREKLGEEEELRWSQHWIKQGFAALEGILKTVSGTYCVGDEVTLADVVLVPQVKNAARFKVSMAEFPTISKICDELHKLPAVQDSIPQKQPDAPL